MNLNIFYKAFEVQKIFSRTKKEKKKNDELNLAWCQSADTDEETKLGDFLDANADKVPGILSQQGERAESDTATLSDKH